MKLPFTLSVYFGRQFFLWFLAIMAGLMSIVYIGEALELLRRSTARPDVSFGIILQMSALKITGTAQVLFASAVLFTGLYTFWRLSRSHELEVARAAGVSVWVFTAPIMLVALLLGVIQVSIINPLAAGLTARYERMDDRYLRGRASTLEVSKGGIWISQADSQSQAFIHAETVKPGTFELQKVIVFINPHDIETGYRIDAESAKLQSGLWRLTDAWVTREGAQPVRVATYDLPTELTRARIEESFAPPETVSLWKLPEFIRTLEAAGLSSLRHELYYQSLLARPLLLVAMVLVAAVFGVRQARRGGIFAMAVSGLVAGLLLFVGNDVIQTFGQTGSIPVLLAAWGPAIVGILAASAALFHFEDG